MAQPGDDTGVGYALKRAQALLHSAMDEQLHPLGIGVPQYSCLTLLANHPGISNAALARGVFVSRQATHQLLAGLRASGLIETAGHGRAQRLSLSRTGRTVLRDAAIRVDGIERAMLADLGSGERDALLGALTRCADALDGTRRTEAEAAP